MLLFQVHHSMKDRCPLCSTEWCPDAGFVVEQGASRALVSARCKVSQVVEGRTTVAHLAQQANGGQLSRDVECEVHVFQPSGVIVTVTPDAGRGKRRTITPFQMPLDDADLVRLGVGKCPPPPSSESTYEGMVWWMRRLAAALQVRRGEGEKGRRGEEEKRGESVMFTLLWVCCSVCCRLCCSACIVHVYPRMATCL